MKNVAAALVKAQKAFGPALKTHTNPAFRSKYADLSACVEAVVDSLNANGIFLTQKNSESPEGVTVETLFIHESGEVISSGPLFVPAVKKDAQGFGSALTYCRRYSLMAACGIAPEDDDGNAAVKRPEPRGVVATVLADSPAIEPKRMAYIDGFGEDMVREFEEGRTPASIVTAIDAEKLDDIEKIYLWGNLPSAMRSAIKREQEAQRRKVAT